MFSGRTPGSATRPPTACRAQKLCRERLMSFGSRSRSRRDDHPKLKLNLRRSSARRSGSASWKGPSRPQASRAFASPQTELVGSANGERSGVVIALGSHLGANRPAFRRAAVTVSDRPGPLHGPYRLYERVCRCAAFRGKRIRRIWEARDLIAPGLLGFRRWTRDTSLSATDFARRRIDPSTWPGRLNHRREPGAVAGLACYFDGSCFLRHAAVEL